MADYKVKTILPSAMQVADQFHHRWAIKVDGVTAVDDILQPSFWVHNAARLKQFAIIDILPENGSYYAELLVTKVVTTSTGVCIPTLVVLRHVDLSEADSKAPEGTYEVAWQGAVNKHVIIRKADREPIEKGISKKEDAYARVRELEAA